MRRLLFALALYALPVSAQEDAEPVELRLRATLSENGPAAEAPLDWRISDEGGVVYETRGGARLARDLPPGRYSVEVTRPDGAGARADVILRPDRPRDLALALPAPQPEVTLEAAGRGTAGATIPVTWSGPGARGDYVAVGLPGNQRDLAYTYAADGSPLALRLPSEAGRYEIRYRRGDDGTVLARHAIEVGAVTASLTAEEDADAGALLPLVWTGPDYPNDYLAVARPGAADYLAYVYTRTGSPALLRMPAEPGTYELRYVMAQDRKVLATRPVEVLPVEAMLDAPDRIPAGAELRVGWDGPAYPEDRIAVVDPGSGLVVSEVPASQGSPARLPAPLAAGPHELRYLMGPEKAVLARRPLEVAAVTAQLSAVSEAAAGAPVAVAWEGPGYDGDYIAVARPDAEDYAVFRPAREGTPLIVDMPTEPGDWELRYVASGAGEAVLARRTITLAPVAARLEAPAEVAAGAPFAVTWEGPDYRRDYLGLVGAGAPDGETMRAVYTSQDSPLVLRAPDIPGAYELRYHLGRDDRVIARLPLRVTAPD
ncbi:hypothetical protein [Roseivivax sp. CAU 1761]